eukprot:1148812-Pelagomonas_calceolata.AAC.20
MRGELMWIRWVSGSTLLQGSSVMISVFVFNGTSGRGRKIYNTLSLPFLSFCFLHWQEERRDTQREQTKGRKVEEEEQRVQLVKSERQGTRGPEETDYLIQACRVAITKARHPSHLLPLQRHVHIVEVKCCEETRPKNQLEASKQQHRDLCRDLSRTSAQVTLHTILLGVGGVVYTPRTLKPLKELGLDTFKATKLALKLYAHSVEYAYRLASTERALEKTYFNSHRQDKARVTASNPLGPH